MEKSEGIPTDHKVDVFSDRPKTGSCGRSLHGPGKREMMGVGGSRKTDWVQSEIAKQPYFDQSKAG